MKQDFEIRQEAFKEANGDFKEAERLYRIKRKAQTKDRIVEEGNVRAALNWLFDPSEDPEIRGTGRSQLLAETYARLVLNTGEVVKPRDHYPYKNADELLTQRVMNEIGNLIGNPFKRIDTDVIKWNKDTIQIKSSANTLFI